MKKLKFFFVNFKNDWNAETPKIAKLIRNLAFNLMWIIPSGTGAMALVPQTARYVAPLFWKIIGITLFVCGIVAGYAGRQKVSPPDQNTNK